MEESLQSRQFSITWLLVMTALVAVAVRLWMWAPAWAVALGSGLWWPISLRLVPLPQERDRRDDLGMMALILSFSCWCMSMLSLFLVQLVSLLGPGQTGFALLVLVVILTWLLGLMTILVGFMGLLMGSRRAALLAIINLAVTIGIVALYVDSQIAPV